MAEEDLKKAIRGKILEEGKRILTKAGEEADSVLKQARAEAAALREKYLEEIGRRSLLKKTIELSRIELEARRKILEAKEKKICLALSLARENAKTLRRDRRRYKAILRQLMQESLGKIGTDRRVKLKVNPLDRELALDILRELKADAQLETAESIEGGLELCDLEGDLRILNTLGSRFEKLAPELRSQINRILFSN